MKRKSSLSTFYNSNNKYSVSKSQSYKKRNLLNNDILTTSNEPSNDNYSSKKIENFFQLNNNSTNKSTLHDITSQINLFKHITTTKQINPSLCNFFSEIDVSSISNSFKINVIPQFKQIYETISMNKQFLFFNYSSMNYDKYIKLFLDIIITKYILNAYDNLIYVPKRFIESKLDNNKYLLKLIAGYNETKKIKLLYEPINVDESKYVHKELTNTIVQYIHKFKTNSKSKHKFQNALVLYKPGNDFIENVNNIEIICNDLGYQIIKIDELESQKYNKLNKIEEATKSKRLWTIDEDLLTKINIIENMYIHNDIKWSSFIQRLNITYDLNNEDEIDINNHNNKEYKSFKIFQGNIYNINITKRTLILIVDSFTPNDDNNKLYLSNIITKILQTKCPIIILTNNLSIFYTISPPIHICNFDVYKITNDNNINNNSIIYLISLLVYLHICIKPSISNDIEIIVKDIYKQNKDFQLETNVNYLYETIVIISFCLCLKNEFNLDKILIQLSNILRKKTNVSDMKEKLENIKKDVYIYLNNDKIYDCCLLDINNEIKQLCFDYEKESYHDYEKGKMLQLGNKRFEYLIKFKMKNSNHVNIEMIHYQDEHNNPKPNYILDICKYKERLYEMKYFYHMYLSNSKMISLHSIYEYNYLILSMLNIMTYEQVVKLFGIRKTRKSSGEKEMIGKINVIHRMFKYASIEMLNLFINTFDEEKLYIKCNKGEQWFVKEGCVLGFYRNNVLYDKIKQSLLIYHNNYNKKRNSKGSESENECNFIFDDEGSEVN